MSKRANGEGTISKRKKDGKTIGWKGSVTLGLRADGSPDRRWVSGRSRDEVREKIDALKSDRRTGMLADAEGLSVAELLDRWVESKERDGVKPNTARSYRDTARLYLTPHLGRIRLEKLRPLDVERTLTALRKEGKSLQILAYSLRVLGMALRQAVRWQMVPRNVAEVIKAPKIDREEMQVWTPEQVAAFLGATESHRLHAAFYLALLTGMRRGELLGLQWQDIDWKRSRLKVRHNLVEVRKESEGRIYRGKPTVSRIELSLQTPKTKGSRRTIPLSPGTIEKLREHRDRQAVERAAAAEAWPNKAGEGFVFASALGTATDPRNFYRWYGEIVEQAGVPRIRFHDLRHTAASLMIRRGHKPKTVSDRLGHADVGFTLRIYTHLYDDEREEAAFDLSDLLPQGA